MTAQSSRTLPIAKKVPLLGSAIPLLRDPLNFLRQEYARLGPAFRVKAAKRSFVVLGGPEANRFATGKGRDNFESKTFWGPFTERLDCPHMILAIDGPPHRDLRRAYQRDLSRRVVLDRTEEVSEIIRDVTTRAFADGQPQSARAYTRVLVSSLISRLLTGRDVLDDIETLEAVLEFQRWQLNALLLGKWPRQVLQLPQFARYERTTLKFLRHHQQQVAEAQPVGWFASMDKIRASRPELFEPGDVAMHHMLPYFAGVDTVGVTLVFLLQELLVDGGRRWRTLHDELTAASVDGALPDPKTLCALPKLNAAWREAMRLYPAAFGVYRNAAQQFEFDGYRVEAGEDVLLFTTAAHTDPERFPEPMRFRVDRPLKSYRDGHAFAPYGKGPHVCLGAGMAEVLLPLILANWLKHDQFTLEKPNKRYATVFDPSPTLPERFKIGHRRRHEEAHAPTKQPGLDTGTRSTLAP